MKKFVIIQCAEAYHSQLQRIFKEIHIRSYSEMPVNGFLEGMEGTSDISNWFGSEKNPYSYILSFAVMDSDKADELLSRIETFNKKMDDVSPINAFVSHIEKFV